MCGGVTAAKEADLPVVGVLSGMVTPLLPLCLWMMAGKLAGPTETQEDWRGNPAPLVACTDPGHHTAAGALIPGGCGQIDRRALQVQEFTEIWNT